MFHLPGFSDKKGLNPFAFFGEAKALMIDSLNKNIY